MRLEEDDSEYTVIDEHVLTEAKRDKELWKDQSK